MSNIYDLSAAKGKRISEVTQRLMDVATKGEEKVITAKELVQKFVDGEATSAQVIQIFTQNGVWPDMLLGAVAASMGIKPSPVLEAIVDGWIDWPGDQDFPPTGAGDLVLVRLADGTETTEPKSIGHWNWRHGESETGGDLVAYKIVKADDGWVEWDGIDIVDGYPCGIEAKTVIDIKFRDGRIQSHTDAVGWIFNHTSEDDDIVAYRIVKAGE